MDEIKKPEPLKKYIEKTKYRVFVIFVILNYPFRWLAYGLDKVAFLKILEYVSLLGVIVAVYFYVSESGERLKAKHYQAWQVIIAAQGKPGSGGRIDALKDLNKDKVSLNGVDLSGAYLVGLNLENAELTSANLSRANLLDANLSGADLDSANLSGAYLWDANLSGAEFTSANLTGANLTNANLSAAYLRFANLSGADLSGANLSGAIFMDANLSGVDLWDANLSEAVLDSANLSGANFMDANLYGANLGGANLSGTKLSFANLSGVSFDFVIEKSNFLKPQSSKVPIKIIEDSIQRVHVYARNWESIKDIRLANIYGITNEPNGFTEWAKEHGAVSFESYDEWKKLIIEEERKEQNKKTR